MEIKIRPQVFVGQDWWREKEKGVVLVKKRSDISRLHKLLIEQDDYWESHKDLIQVAPKEIDSVKEISKMCGYVGKTDIYEVLKLKQKIDFILYQEDDCEC
ncbi:MAG: hypothetical protein ABI091_25820 [Ferruginibacter sp.]